MVKAAKILNIPIYITTQNAARLGDTVSELTTLLPSPDATPTDPKSMSDTTPPTLLHDKTAFSMMTPTLLSAVAAQAATATTTPQPLEIILVGIETHICVTQTALDLLSAGHHVYVLADGVSSCNAGERWVALERLRSRGATITTSESVLFELLGDAKSEAFKAVSALVTKEFKEKTKGAVGAFCAR
ncbi:uncharacterized protein HMPREF1541_06073 [Cyphellophora europaea CBS 101466]|uniref:Isochorismatase-like domain-containing protein n=1 Tax=Cyphellophora europaea (strain CBS 101466) TaxID=1220924 RepID=W2RTT0_CYPE1|nr:uncharacterized protein HMPREF1541_06073 [Cyphellophora europaea CBS 101466]ETN39847.1 hypothetical protein HMPREF1541_06073 [Cyphellophora europaea CBS 101466]